MLGTSLDDDDKTVTFTFDVNDEAANREVFKYYTRPIASWDYKCNLDAQSSITSVSMALKETSGDQEASGKDDIIKQRLSESYRADTALLVVGSLSIFLGLS